MKNRLWLLLLALSVFAIACGGGKQKAEEKGVFTEQQIEAQEAAYRQMMDVHDEVMPKMGEMNSAARELKPLLETTQDEELKTEIMEVLQALEMAEDGMMEWMQASPRMPQLRDSLSHDAIMGILQAEQPKVDKVKEDILNSLAKAQELLAKLQGSES